MKKTLYFLALGLLGAGFFALRRYRANCFRIMLSSRDFVTGLPELEPDMRLVVARVDLIKTLTAESRKVSWGVDWGTTKVSLSVPARVHYAIDHSGLEPIEFRIDQADNTFTAVFPDPQIQAVEIFLQNKQTVVEPGWGRLATFSGQSLLDQIEHSLYNSAKSDGTSARALAQVKDIARQLLTRQVSVYLKRVGLNFKNIQVRFHSDEENGEPRLALSTPDEARYLQRWR